jgi:hypothetical protein
MEEICEANSASESDAPQAQDSPKEKAARKKKVTVVLDKLLNDLKDLAQIHDDDRVHQYGFFALQNNRKILCGSSMAMRNWMLGPDGPIKGLNDLSQVTNIKDYEQSIEEFTKEHGFNKAFGQLKNHRVRKLLENLGWTTHFKKIQDEDLPGHMAHLKGKRICLGKIPRKRVRGSQQFDSQKCRPSYENVFMGYAVRR